MYTDIHRHRQPQIYTDRHRLTHTDEQKELTQRPTHTCRNKQRHLDIDTRAMAYGQILKILTKADIPTAKQTERYEWIC